MCTYASSDVINPVTAKPPCPLSGWAAKKRPNILSLFLVPCLDRETPKNKCSVNHRSVLALSRVSQINRWFLHPWRKETRRYQQVCSFTIGDVTHRFTGSLFSELVLLLRSSGSSFFPIILELVRRAPLFWFVRASSGCFCRQTASTCSSWENCQSGSACPH